MTSEIKVDTISEQTSANGVAVDGLTIKDGGIVGATTITNDDNENTLKLVSTDADQNRGPILTLHRNSGSPADGDLVGIIQFNVQDDAPSEHGLAFISATLSDATAGSEDGILDFNLDLAGTNRSRMTFNATEAVFNDDSQDIDFRVESNGNTHQLFVDGGNDRIYVGGGSGSSIGSNRFQVQNGGATISSFANDSGSNQLHFIKSRNTTVGSQTIVNDGDSVGGIFWKADDGDATDYNNNVAGIEGVIDGTPGTNDTPGRLVFYTTSDGERTNTERVRIHSGGVMSASQGIALGVGTANTASNVLDDYEEGTWTPVLGSTGAAYGSVSHSQQLGFYTKIGRQVHVYFSIASSSVTVGSPSGNVSITGVPFTCQNATADTAGSLGYVSNLNINISSFGAFHLGVIMPANDARINFARSRNSNGADGWPATTIPSSGFTITGSCTYYV